MQAKWSFAAALVAVVALAGAQALAGDYKGKPGTYRDLEDVDTVQVVEVFKLADFQQVLVQVDTSKAPLPTADDSDYDNVKTVLERTSRTLVAAMQKELKKRAQVAEAPAPGAATEPATTTKVLLMRCEVTKVNPGSAAARSFIGVGAGSASIDVKGEFVDAQTNKVLLTFETGRGGSGGAFGFQDKSTIGVLTGAVKELGQDLAKVLLAM